MSGVGILADLAAERDAALAEVAALRAEVERLRRRLGQTVRMQARMAEARRVRWEMP